MGDQRTVPFEGIGWADDVPGIRTKEAQVEGARWALVEYEAGARREEWCEEGHRGFVIKGGIQYEFDDGREPLRAFEDEALFLPPAPLDRGVHRGHNLASGPTHLFLIVG